MNMISNNNLNSVPVTYGRNTKRSVCQSGNEETVSFDRTLRETKPEVLPSFVGKVYTEEELYQYVDDKLRENECNKKTFEDVTKETCPDWETATFKFVGEEKLYTYYEFIKEFEKRSQQKLQNI